MAHTYTNLLYHSVWSTKNRAPLIDDELKESLFPYLGGIIRGIKGIPLFVNGTSDHVHVFMVLPQTMVVADAIRVIKTNSSGWVHKKWQNRQHFGWQIGYGAFSVSESNREHVIQYVKNQEKHHKKLTFQQEFVLLLDRHKIEYDPEVLWE